ncbi:hypothetical protein HP548_00700 [Paenibacillus taichungensis]|uniref:Bro-N domain-containing protein n=1 Tax=Paenibacillus taichungensis TaxID=484184 RepID=A0ABX2ME11_9BACL|nr:ORF6C domain-containing protein [Paenibacillus taichungensis]NUU52629.1 hypothetical protein [Paenibacillus taichungensis]
MSSILPFMYGDYEVRTVTIDDATWFVAKDVCNVLEILDVRRAVERLDDDERSLTPLVDSAGKRQEMYSVNEPGLYSLILGSRKPESKQFKRWITHEVIPIIRKTGQYSVQTLDKDAALAIALRKTADVMEQLPQIQSRLERVENNTTINYGQQRRLAQIGNEVVLTTLGGADSSAYRNNSLRAKTYSALWRDHKDYFQINSMRDTLVKDFDKALDRVSAWYPQGRLLREIENMNRQMAL